MKHEKLIQLWKIKQIKLGKMSHVVKLTLEIVSIVSSLFGGYYTRVGLMFQWPIENQ